MSDEEYEAWTGWTKNQFYYICIYDQISPFFRFLSNRTSRNAFAIFWIKMTTNLSFPQIGSLFKISGDSESRRKRAAVPLDSVRKLLVELSVAKNLGINHMPKEEAKTHDASYARVRWLRFGYRQKKK